MALKSLDTLDFIYLVRSQNKTNATDRKHKKRPFLSQIKNVILPCFKLSGVIVPTLDLSMNVEFLFKLL